jgi:hypothetical protein
MQRNVFSAFPELRLPLAFSMGFCLAGIVFVALEARSGPALIGMIFIMASMSCGVCGFAALGLGRRLLAYEDRIRQLEERLQEHPAEVP